jgi:hypothetical protein
MSSSETEAKRYYAELISMYSTSRLFSYDIIKQFEHVQSAVIYFVWATETSIISIEKKISKSTEGIFFSSILIRKLGASGIVRLQSIEFIKNSLEIDVIFLVVQTWN